MVIKMKIGLEIHFQLKGSKLFCSCDTEGEKTDFVIERKMTPVMSEMGEMDSAVKYEYIRNRKFIYHTSTNSCLVEKDDEPPHNVDYDALKTAIALSMGLHCKIVDYVSFMRKLVIDGSNTSGFQRTGIIGMNGYIKTSKGNVNISTITLEEDAARKIMENEEKAEYSLDRLGIPLIEISTEPDIINQEHALETAKAIGYLVMSMDNFRGEVDSIRQDVNFSMGYGRVEIKGVSKLSFIRDTVNYEINRQESLNEISRILKIKGCEISNFSDITDIFKNTESSMIKKAIKSGKSVFAARITNVNHLMKYNNYHLGKELADVAKNMGIGGMMHSDEFPGYGISDKELNNVYNLLIKGENDGIIIVLTYKNNIDQLLSLLRSRLNKIINMDLAETRAATGNGETRYLRPLPGKERMYPETDVPLFEINENLLNEAREIIPETMEEVNSKLNNEYKLSNIESDGIINNNLYNTFVKLIKIYNEPRTISRLLLQTIPELNKKYNSKIGNEDIIKILNIAKNAGWDRSNIEKALEIFTVKKININELIKMDELKSLNDDEIKKIIAKLINNNSITEKNIIPSFKKETNSTFNAKKVIEIYKKLKN